MKNWLKSTCRDQQIINQRGVMLHRVFAIVRSTSFFIASTASDRRIFADSFFHLLLAGTETSRKRSTITKHIICNIINKLIYFGVRVYIAQQCTTRRRQLLFYIIRDRRDLNALVNVYMLYNIWIRSFFFGINPTSFTDETLGNAK